MKWRVWEEKILLVQAIGRQEVGGLAMEVLEEQINTGWPGLAQEVAEICKDSLLPDAAYDIGKEDINSQ